MKYGDFSLSYPVVYFNVDVTYFDARKSTAIEWCVLELLRKVQKMPKYATVSLDELFSRIFKIDNPDLLVKPCIIELQGTLGAIDMEKIIYDTTRLADIPAGSLHLTEKGLEMHEKGLLPGRDTLKSEELFFDITSETVGFSGSDKKSQTSAPLGIPIVDEYDRRQWWYENKIEKSIIRSYVSFATRDFLNSRLEQGSYLSKSSVIKDISLSLPENKFYIEPLWINKHIQVGFTKNMLLTTDNLQKPFEEHIIAAALCRESGWENLIDNNFINDFHVQNVDEEYISFIKPEYADTTIASFIRNTPAFFIDKRILKNDIPLKFAKETPKVIISCDNRLNDFSVESGTSDCPRLLMINLPKGTNLSASGVLLESIQNALVIGRFTIIVVNKTNSYSTILGATTRKPGIDLKHLSKEIFSRFSTASEDLIYMLPAFGNDDLFLSTINTRISHISNISERASFIETVNEKSQRFLNRTMLTDDFIKEKLVSEITIGQIDFYEAEKKLYEASSVKIFRNNRDLARQYAEKVLSLCSISKADDLWRLIDRADALGEKNWTKKNPAVQKLFTPDILRNIASKCMDENFGKIPEYTPFESVLKSYIENLKKLEFELHKQRIKLWEEESENSVIQKLLVTSQEDLGKINNLLNLLRERKKQLDEYLANAGILGKDTEESGLFITFMESIETFSDSFKKQEMHFGTICNAIGFFFDDKTVRYDKIYVPDTNALIDHPELIDRFTFINAALVIPQKVIDELDKLKDDHLGWRKEDGLTNKARNARAASGKIQEYQQQKKAPWLTIGKAHPELLSDELDKKKPDNLILSVALRYLAKKPVIITGDKNLSIIADAAKVECMTVEKFLTVTEPKNAKNKEKGKRK